MLASDSPSLTEASGIDGPVTLSLARRAARFPDRTAVVDISEERLYAPAETVHEDRVSYGALSRLAELTASRLEARGIDAGDTVCLVTRNRVASLALLFACRRLEATLAPISHRLTPVTVERPFETLEPDLVVAEAAQRDLVRSIPFDRTVTLSELAETDSSSSGDSDGDSGDGGTTTPGPETGDPRVGDDQTESGRPLLCLHGQGGRPVVAYTARTLEWNCIAAMTTWGLSRDDVVPLVTPLSAHDGLVRTALPVLYVGGRLLLDRAFDPGDTLTAIESADATLLAGRTAAFRDIAAESDFSAAVDSLERAVPDASVPDDVLAPYRDRGISVTRTYGRLECPIAFGRAVRTADADDGGADAADGTDAGNAGPPVLDCRARLLDTDDSEDADATVREGATEGRLELSGPVLAEGYVDADAVASDASDASDAADAVGTRTTEHEVVIEDRTNEHDDDTAPRGRFADGWFDTGEAVRRTENGEYVFDQ